MTAIRVLTLVTGGVLVPFLISPASAITCREFFSALDRTAETGNFEMPKWDKVKDIGIERFIECKDQGLKAPPHVHVVVSGPGVADDRIVLRLDGIVAAMACAVTPQLSSGDCKFVAGEIRKSALQEFNLQRFRGEMTPAGIRIETLQSGFDLVYTIENGRVEISLSPLVE